MVKIASQAWYEMGNEEDGYDSSPKREEEERKFKPKKEKDGKPDPKENGDSELTESQIEEILNLPVTDHSGMQLISSQLNGNNFLNWSKSIKRALAARSKLELLDGTFLEPDSDSPYYKRWLKVDYIVSTWICNSISKDLVDAFSHIENTYKLWCALNHRFGGSNGPKILKLQREIYAFRQGNLSVSVYFNQLNSMWEEMDMLLPPLGCVCNAKKKSMQREDQIRLVAFLVGLNEVYESTKTQIMLLKPLPNLDQAYSMVVQVEDQKRLSEQGGDSRNLMAMNVVQKGNYGTNQQQYGSKPAYQKQTYQKPGNAPFKKRISKEEKRKLKCSHCHEMGHEADECFKLHGVPEWYKKLKEGQGQNRANCVESNADMESANERPVSRDGGQDISKLIQTEIAKCMGQFLHQ